LLQCARDYSEKNAYSVGELLCPLKIRGKFNADWGIPLKTKKTLLEQKKNAEKAGFISAQIGLELSSVTIANSLFPLVLF
jgi:hypothetical protein